MEKEYIIYVHINKTNNKIYIGQTKQKLSRRFRHNGEGYKKCSRFYEAIQKYGWDNFNHLILLENLTFEEANEIEKYLIKKYDSTNPEKGYNISLGGNGINLYSTNIITEKNKEHWSQGIYDNIKTSVYCIELDKQFESALEAQRKTGIDNSSIQKACKQKIKYCGFSPKGEPLHWIYISEKTDKVIKELKFKKEILKGVSIPVYCPELQEVFYSTQEVYNKYNIDPSSIRKVIRGVNKTAGKHPVTNEPLHWIEKPELIQSKNKISQELWDQITGSN